LQTLFCLPSTQLVVAALKFDIPYLSIIADLKLDRSDDPRVRLNFNITMMDLSCDFAVVDVVSVLGTDQNVTSHVTKWHIDGEGVRQRYQGRNKQQKDIQLFDKSVKETIDDLHANGEDAVSLTGDTLEFAKRENEYLFVDFYASWCSHCRDLAPTWETVAEVMVDVAESNINVHRTDYSDEEFEEAKALELPVMIAKIDCVNHPDVCNYKEDIRAYPTLRLFVDGEPWQGGDYRGHRTVLEIISWLQHVEEQHREAMGHDESMMKVHTAHEGKYLYVRSSSFFKTCQIVP
jgi:thiol-disulfide isomerase/thioredoxin